MILKSFKIIKSEVVEEVAEATAYVGAKMTGNTEAGVVNGLDDVATVDEDAEMLVRRFGSEARAGFVERMAGMVTSAIGAVKIAVAKINELKHLRTGVLTRPSHPW
ncbi:MAG: hypothetical protein LIO91_08825 [Bacteroidales bacterium]|nr:hypothetical protein [Bacteroidales bacterium]